MPPEIWEVKALLDDDQPAIRTFQQKLTNITRKLIERNNLDPEIFMPKIYISADGTINAMIAPSAKPPVLIVTLGLLNGARSEDELAGIISHELGHGFLREKANGTKITRATKVEELSADVVAVKFLEDAGYNPRGLIDIVKRFGEGSFQIINVDDVKNAKTLEEKAELIDRITDPHPSGHLRIRSMENAIVALNRQRGRTGENREPVRLNWDFHNSAHSIQYETPLAAGLRKIGYFSMSEEKKMEVLAEIVEQNYIPTNKTSANRLSEISRYIASLQVDYTKERQAGAFLSLADKIMGYVMPKGRKIVHPSNARLGSSIVDHIYPALEQVWAHGHGMSVPRRGRGQPWVPVYVGRLDDLRIAVEGFMGASSAEVAESYAAQIVEIADKVDQSYIRRV